MAKYAYDTTKRRHNKGLYKVILLAAGLGLFGGLVTVAFIKILDLLHQLLWEIIPVRIGINSDIYIFIACIVGGLLVGLINKYFGNYPKPLKKEFEQFKKTGEFDYKHLPQAIAASFASLGFGASLGPEAALVAIVGGLSSWINKKIKLASSLAESASYIGISASLGALFGSPIGVAAFSYESSTNSKLSKIWLVLPGIAAAGVGFLVFKFTLNGGYLDYNFLPYIYQSGDIIKSLPVVVVGIVAGFLYLFAAPLAKRSLKSVTSPVALAVIGGAALAVLASGSTLVLFSGHGGIQQIINDVGSATAAGLLLIALAKIAVTQILLACGWKGGEFFPVMFIGSAIGLACSLLVPAIPAMVAIAAGMAAMLATVLQKPVLSFLLLVFIFPLNLVVFVAIGAFVSRLVLKNLQQNSKFSSIIESA